MGILKVGAGALKSVLEDQWREYFYCPSMEADVLVKKGENRKSKRSYNTKGSDNIITNGSGIAVADGQCMMIVEQGKVVEFCAEPGEFTYDASTEPSIFSATALKRHSRPSVSVSPTAAIPERISVSIISTPRN